MQAGVKITEVRGRGLPLRGDDLDTDRIIPARFLKELTFENMGKYVFFDERFDPAGRKKEHPFNDPRFAGTAILVVNKNFGCGSSREHAAQAINRFGIKALIGESFSPIFAANCNVLGVPCVQTDAKTVEALMRTVEAGPETEITLLLTKKTVTYAGETISFGMPPEALYALVSGQWDPTQLLLANLAKARQTADRLPYLDGFKRN